MKPHDPNVPLPGAFVDTIQSGNIPSRQEFVQYLTEIDPLKAVLLLALGLVYMLYGWKAFKILVIANAGMIGIVLGAMVGRHMQGTETTTSNLPTFTAIAGGLLLAVAAWPLMKYAVSLMGALVGSLVGYGLWRYLAEVSGQITLGQYAWAGALLGLVTLGMLAFVIFQITVMILTSIQGTMMTVSGILALLLRYPSIGQDLRNSLLTEMHLLPLLIIVPAAIGFIFQHAAFSGKAKKKKPAE
jgi:hypothetical protein